MDATTSITATSRRSRPGPGAGSGPPPASAPRIGALRGWTLVASLLLVVAMSDDAVAHDPGLSAMTLETRPDRITAHLVIARREIEPLVAIDTDGDGTVTAQELALARPRLHALGAAAVTLDPAGGVPVVDRVDVDASDALHVRLTFTGTVGARAHVSVPLIGRLALGHRQYVQVRGADGHRVVEHVLHADAPGFTLPDGAALGGAGGELGAFVRLGVEHIATGYDHVLFLVALLVVGPRLRTAAAIITSFTAAHSVSLALATLGLVRLAPAVVEPLIAASVIYVGLDNLRARHLAPRWMATFGLGLVHGLGFAGALRDVGVGDTAGAVIVPLLGFNVGVEAGQLAVAAIVLPLVWKAQRHPWLFSRVAATSSRLAVVAGAAWLVQRTLLD